MSTPIEQALYGYSNGHRAIAGSTQIDGEASRALRSATDMAFDGDSERYLTSLPLPDLRHHALIRTWPAPEAPRPGSVWSHVLLVDFVDLGAITHFWSLTTLFRRPGVTHGGEVDSAPYTVSLTLPSRPRHIDVDGNDIDRLRILYTIYGDSSADVVRADNPERLEATLLEIWSQQWPRLRRSFAFRTRYRVGNNHSDFDLHLVERLQRDQPHDQLPVDPPAWLARLDEDLRKPSDGFRDFLHRFGTESVDGRRDLPRLVDVKLASEQNADAASLVAVVCAAFPSSSEMTSLKQALFGRPSRDSSVVAFTEAARLEAIMHGVPASALDLDQLELRERLVTLWGANRKTALRLLGQTVSAEAPNHHAVRILVDAAMDHLVADDIPALATANPAIAAAVIARRRDLLTEPVVWQSGEEVIAQLLDIVRVSEPQFRESILIRLIASGQLSAAIEVLKQEPTAWWSAVAWAGDALSKGRSPVRLAASLEQLLDAIGPASIGSSPSSLSDDALTLLALVASPRIGLWRQAGPDRWVRVAESLGGVSDRKLRARGMLVLLAATRLADGASARRNLWLVAFGPLHNLLVEDALSDDDLEFLLTVVPGSDPVEPADRLRRALVREIRRDKWAPQDLRIVTSAAGPHGELIVKALREKTKGRKRWLRDVLDYIAR